MLGTRLGRPTMQRADPTAKATLVSGCHLPGHTPPAPEGVPAVGPMLAPDSAATKEKRGTGRESSQLAAEASRRGHVGPEAKGVGGLLCTCAGCGGLGSNRAS